MVGITMVSLNSYAFEYKDENGKMIKAGATADKNGFFYVLDRVTGKYIRSTPFR